MSRLKVHYFGQRGHVSDIHRANAVYMRFTYDLGIECSASSVPLVRVESGKIEARQEFIGWPDPQLQAPTPPSDGPQVGSRGPSPKAFTLKWQETWASLQLKSLASC